MSSNVCVVVFFGGPATGKTSFLKFLLENSSKFDFLLKYFSYDDFIKIDENFKEFLESENFKEARKSVLNEIEFCIEKCLQNKSEKYLIIIDDNNYYKSMRYEFYKSSKKFNSGFFQIFFNSGLKESLDRNSNRTKSLNENAVRNIFNKIEKPDIRNKWEENTLTFNIDAGDSFQNLEQKLCQTIEERFNNPEVIIDQSLVQIRQSSIHEIDLILRKSINQRLKASTGMDLRKYATELNLRRKQLLSDLRNNILEIPHNFDSLNELIF